MLRFLIKHVKSVKQLVIIKKNNKNKHNKCFIWPNNSNLVNFTINETTVVHTVCRQASVAPSSLPFPNTTKFLKMLPPDLFCDTKFVNISVAFFSSKLNLNEHTFVNGPLE